ncbi:TetR/AcrR family transcriptional regulator [Microvirga massiliensis]|uniref:TetR/AcrR family transcriptional regulator n=1 Tax=Microvirga massiliensis TaxID=1033741 RepID=UPI00062BCD54|nr:TetR/AcrR family transcriptional regulator [Microvirga massiliensis]
MNDTRAELILQAELLVRRQGYSGFSYAHLAEVVGIRKASIHHHFPTKTDLALALVAAYDARYDEALAAILADSDDGVARVEAYATLYLEGIEKGLGCLCAVLAIEMDILSPQLRAEVERFFAKHVAWLETVLADGIANGTIRASVDPASFARMVISTLEGALMVERLLGDDEGFHRTISALKDSLR